MHNKGLRAYRFEADNLIEKLFAEEWEKRNVSSIDGKIDGDGTLDRLLDTDDQRYRPKQAEDRDREVAATVIQWLGSLVGFSFLQTVLEKVGYEIRKKEEGDL